MFPFLLLLRFGGFSLLQAHAGTCGVNTWAATTCLHEILRLCHKQLSQYFNVYLDLMALIDIVSITCRN